MFANVPCHEVLIKIQDQIHYPGLESGLEASPIRKAFELSSIIYAFRRFFMGATGFMVGRWLVGKFPRPVDPNFETLETVLIVC